MKPWDIFQIGWSYDNPAATQRHCFEEMSYVPKYKISISRAVKKSKKWRMYQSGPNKMEFLFFGTCFKQPAFRWRQSIGHVFWQKPVLPPHSHHFGLKFILAAFHCEFNIRRDRYWASVTSLWQVCTWDDFERWKAAEGELLQPSALNHPWNIDWKGMKRAANPTSRRRWKSEKIKHSYFNINHNNFCTTNE